MELERLARACDHAECAAPAPEVGADGWLEALVGAAAAGVRGGWDRACLARRFHSGLAAVVAAALTAAADQTGAEVVGLSGGVFQNRLLTGAVLAGLADVGRPVLTHRLVPAGDGGLALGQARAGHSLLTWT
jgi:hydrogenase maturation protein HypF